jgi:hypothetical protein
MAIEPVPYIDPAPVPGPQRADEPTFDDRMDAKIRWDETSAQQFGDLADNVVHNATEAEASATEAGNQAIAAGNYAAGAQDSAEASAASAGDSAASAASALDSAAAAAVSSTGLIANSTTAIALGNGNKVFAVPIGKQFQSGIALAAVSAGTPTAKMFGTGSTYSGTSLTIAVTQFEGPVGTYSDWVISTSGAQGPQGGTAGGQLTSALDEKKGGDLASAATIDPWSTGGNSMTLTGSLIITGIANAPQAGAKRTLLVAGAPVITNNSNIAVKGGTLLLAAGDEIDIEAETITKFRVTVRRGDGSAVTPLTFRMAEFFDTATVWIAPSDGLVRFHAAGGCGSGGVAARAYASAPAAASGGSAGGFSIKTLYVKAGDAFTITPGARGLGVSLSTVSAAANGNDAGTTTITGPGVSITCNGGKGGKGAFGSNGTVTAAGQSGGTATGGDVNYTGGSSGTATATTNSATTTSAPAIAATGGAAISYKGTAYHSGAAVANSSAGASNAGDCMAATGGSSVGGNSGDATSTLAAGASTAVRSASGGAGTVSGSSAAVNTGTIGGTGMPVAATQTPLSLRDAGQVALTALTTPSSLPALGLSGGAGGGLDVVGNTVIIGASATSFAGSSGLAVNQIGTGSSVAGGSCNYGGSTGGVAAVVNTTVTISSGDAGVGFVLIEHN